MPAPVDKLYLFVANTINSLFQLFSSSLIEIQNARGIMDILSEMLSAIGPENREVIGGII